MAIIDAQSFTGETNSATAVLIAPGADPENSRNCGQVLVIRKLAVAWNTSVTSISHTISLTSGWGSTWTHQLYSESVTGTYWIWTPDPPGSVILLPKFTGHAVDKLSVVILAGGDGNTPYITCEYEVEPGR